MIDIDTFLAEAGIEAHWLQDWIDREWLLPQRRSASLRLSEIDAARARFIRDLKSDFGVNDEGIEIVLHLVDQIHGLRQAVTRIRTEVRIERAGAAPRPRGRAKR